MTHSSPENAGLLPCPFCGNQPSLKIMGDGVSIRCKTFFCPLEDIEIPDDTLDEAKKRWNKRPLIRAQCMPSRIDKGRAFYLAMYEKDGATWAANDHKGLWCDMAEDYERRISAFTSPECTYNPDLVAEIKKADAEPPEAEFSNAQEALDYLNDHAPFPRNQPQRIPSREEMAGIVYEGAHKGLKNCWKWADDGLDAEHPGRRGYYYKIADAVLAALFLTRPECGGK